MRKQILAAAAAVMICGVMTACGNETENTQTKEVTTEVTTVATENQTESQSATMKDGTARITGKWGSYPLSEESKTKVKEALDGKVYTTGETFDIAKLGLTEDESKFKDKLYKGIRFLFYDKEADGTSLIYNKRKKVEVAEINFTDDNFLIVINYYS